MSYLCFLKQTCKGFSLPNTWAQPKFCGKPQYQTFVSPRFPQMLSLAFIF